MPTHLNLDSTVGDDDSTQSSEPESKSCIALSSRTAESRLNLTKKRHFQLLEILIAMFLIVSCAFPAITVFVNVFKEESKLVRMHVKGHVAHLIHAKLIEQFYQPSKLQEAVEQKTGTIDTNFIPELASTGIEASYAFEIVHPDTEKAQNEGKKVLYKLIIYLDDSQGRFAYDYLMFVKRGKQ